MLVVPGPSQYRRMPGLLKNSGLYIKQYGKSALLVGGETALSVSDSMIIDSLKENEIEYLGSIPYGGECSWSQINRLVDLVQTHSPDVLVAVGGGKALDTVKAVAYVTELPVIAVPTIAATCAAATSISIIYDDEGTFIDISHKSKAPNLVLVDMEIIQKAPYRFLIAGIGDTLAKWFESRASIQNVTPNAMNQSAVRLAEGVYQLLLEKGEEALVAIQNGNDHPAINDVVDSIILVSGSVSGYGGDDCRTAAAHAIYSGLTIFPEVHHTYHGEIVAFGILAQLVMEGKPEQEMIELVSYYKRVRLPITLNSMGISELTEDQWRQLGEVTVEIEDMENMPFTVTPEMVIEAVKGADQIGRQALMEC
jgi:glycerol dehydrogenase